MKNIEKVMAIYIDEENKAAQKCMECQELYHKQLCLLDDLRQYEVDYQRNFLEIANEGVRIEKIKNFNNFIRKLHVLIDKQTENVSVEKKNLDAATQIWQTKRLERRRLSKLDEKMAKKQRHAYAISEQKLSDEIALQQHRRNDTHS